jgi:hypothetical protein
MIMYFIFTRIVLLIYIVEFKNKARDILKFWYFFPFKILRIVNILNFFKQTLLRWPIFWRNIEKNLK